MAPGAVLKWRQHWYFLQNSFSILLDSYPWALPGLIAWFWRNEDVLTFLWKNLRSNDLHPGVLVWHHFWTAPFKKYKVNVCELSDLVWRNYHTLMTQRDFRLNRPDPRQSMTAWLAIFFPLDSFNISYKNLSRIKIMLFYEKKTFYKRLYWL